MEPDESIGVDSILAEIEEVCRAYGPGKIRQAKTPYLASIAVQLEVTRDQLIEQAVAAIVDERYRATAYVLLVDAEVRQNNFTQRTRLAAAEFGVGVDAFRRVPKNSGLSTRSLVLLEVAQQASDLVVQPQVVSGDRAVDAVSDSPEPPVGLEGSVPPSGLGSGLLRFVLIGLVGVGLLVAIRFAFLGSGVSSIMLAGEVDVSLQCEVQVGSDAVAIPDTESAGWLCKSEDGRREPADMEQACDAQYGTEASAQNLSGNNSSWRCVTHFPVEDGEDCPFAAGAFNPSASDIHSPYAVGFWQRYEAAGGHSALGCPTQLIHHWAVGLMQEIEDQDGRDSALLAREPGETILLTGSAWGAFDRVKGLTGELVGFPTTEPYQTAGIYYVDLSAGGFLISVAEDAPYHWIPPIVFASWESIGGVDSCVGLPISDPYTANGSFKQDFERGTFSLSVVTGALSHTGDGC